MKSLKRKIMLPILIVAVLGIFMLSGVSFMGAKKILLSNVKEIARNKVEKLVTSADDWIREWEGKVDILSTISAVKNLDFNSANEYISKNKENYKDFEAILISDKNGKFFSTTGNNGNISDRDYFPKVMKGDTIVSNPVISRVTGEPIIVIASPIKDDNGRIIGLVGGTVNLSIITDIVNSEKLGQNGYAYMIDKKGIVMAHPNEEFILKENFLNTEDESSFKEIIKKMINGEVGTEEVAASTEEQSAAINEISTSAGQLTDLSIKLQGMIQKFKI